MMAWPSAQLAIAHGAQRVAHRLRTDRDREALVDPLRQIDQPPAYHAVKGRARAGIDDRRERATLRGVQQRRLARSLAVDQARRTFGVEGQNPVPD
jgi:hypothetical protein